MSEEWTATLRDALTASIREVMPELNPDDVRRLVLAVRNTLLAVGVTEDDGVSEIDGD